MLHSNDSCLIDGKYSINNQKDGINVIHDGIT